MAAKIPGTPRNTSSSRKRATKQAIPQVTPIRESNGAASDNGSAQQPSIQDEIRARAYQLYLERGGQDGFDQEDWARAEREILSKYQRGKSA